MDIVLFTPQGYEFLLRWIHFLAGIAWIGLLYYFNFVQGEWFKETTADAKSAAIQKLVPRALWWFRWGAMFTFISGFIILMMRAHAGGSLVYQSSWGVMIITGATLGTLMFLNVWMIIWPKQKVVIASAEAVAAGGQADPNAASALAKAALASRTNTLFSIPMLFFMGAASHLGLGGSVDAAFCTVLVVLGIIIGLLEINGILGKMGPMASVKGVIFCGFLLTAVMYGVIEVLV